MAITLSAISAEFCGNNRIPFGIEGTIFSAPAQGYKTSFEEDAIWDFTLRGVVHKDGHLALLCSRPNCHEKKYAECPERAESKSCSSNTSWVIVRRGEFFEAEEKYDKNDEDVIHFDLISNIRRDYDEKG
ncbi:hypothetical protein TELCIR_05831 [Teladorsagia circumcincta]|uniref:Uncharacterized protein n=1 Tax=Teladorsagia circumcincta TaxID=45464 RepID=A0A2G9URX2_TELCI|nr:hypothetical protein TELCIR_05831 [Teladorsagia circumcincta]